MSCHWSRFPISSDNWSFGNKWIPPIQVGPRWLRDYSSTCHTCSVTLGSFRLHHCSTLRQMAAPGPDEKCLILRNKNCLWFVNNVAGYYPDYPAGSSNAIRPLEWHKCLIVEVKWWLKMAAIRSRNDRVRGSRGFISAPLFLMTWFPIPHNLQVSPPTISISFMQSHWTCL